MNRQGMKGMERRIHRIKKAAKELNEIYGAIPAVERNTARILASIKMLEINISDLFMLESFR